MLARDFAPAGTVDISFKDQELETAFAKQLGAPLLLANVSQQVYQMARAAGLGKQDGTAIIQVLERLAGVKVARLEHDLSSDAAQVHLVLEPDHRRAAGKPAHAVDRGGAGGPQDGLGEERLDGLRGVDVDRGHVGPGPAEPLQTRLHDPHDVRRLLPHRRRGGLAVAHDPSVPTPRSRISPAPATMKVGRGVAPGTV